MNTIRPFPLTLRALASLLVLPGALALHSLAHAAGPEIAHPVRPGDTLEALSAHYLGDARLWPKLQAVNHVTNPRRLQPGSVLHIPMDLLPAGQANAGFVRGQVQMTDPGTQQTRPLHAGQAVPEGSRLQVGSDAFVSVRLADGTVVRIQANSDVLVEQLRKRGRTSDAQSILELHRGAVESSVPPKPGTERHFEIRTPMASTSVRGTRFSVTLADDGRTLSAVTRGTLAVAGLGVQAPPPMAVQHGHGVAVGADGQPGATQTLLAGPDLAALPQVFENADFMPLALAPVPGAAAYIVQLARDADFTEIVRSARFATPQVRLPTPEDGNYYIAARALDSTGLPGLATQRAITIKARPVPPLYQAPAANGVLARTQGALQCTTVVGVQRYRIQVATTADFAHPVLDETRTASCALPVTSLAPGNYYWRAASVRELTGAGLDQGPYAAAQTFRVANQPRAVDTSAMQTTDSGSALQLRWPAEPGQTFRLQAATSPDFAHLLVDEHLSSPNWTTSTLPPGAYYIRLQTRDPSGLESTFSTPRQIRVAAHVQSGFGLPVDASDGRPLAPP